MNEPVLLQESQVESQLRGLFEPLMLSLGLELVLIKASTTKEGKRLCFYLGRPQGVSPQMEELEKASRMISNVLDVEEGNLKGLSGGYTLEVSSPGVDRPLTKRTHFEGCIGKRVCLKMHPESGFPKQIKSILKEVRTEGILLENETRLLEFKNIKYANLVFELNQKPRKPV